MGLFDRLTGARDIQLTPQGGLLLAAISVVAADGDIGDDEMAIIRRLDGSDRTTDWDAAVKAWQTKSLDECIQLAASALNREQRLAAIANLLDIAMSDGELAGAERKLLEVYTEAFDVDERDVSKIVEVIAIKNNKSVFEK